MPRRTPVKDILKEEVVVSSPVRRSSRLNANSPVPTKIVTRRNSSSEETSQAPKPTRSRRLSLTQETETSEEVEKKKPTSTIRTRRSSLTQNKDEEVAEPVRATRSRSSSASKEEIPVKRITRLRRSVSEEPETTDETTIKLTRSRSTSLPKNNDSEDGKKKPMAVPASTPVKKPRTVNEPLQAIEEANKEVDSPVEISSVKSKRKTLEASKIDFDLSVIAEASITEDEEGSPKKKAKVEGVNGTSEVEVKTEPEDVETVPKKLVKDKSTDKESFDTTADASFHLQLSPSCLDNSGENVSRDTSDKENVRPLQEPEEPMDVDDSTYDIFSPAQDKSLKVSIGLKMSEIEEKLQHTETVNDAMAEFLAKEIQRKNAEEENQDEVENNSNDNLQDSVKDKPKVISGLNESSDDAEEVKKLNQKDSIEETLRKMEEDTPEEAETVEDLEEKLQDKNDSEDLDKTGRKSITSSSQVDDLDTKDESQLKPTTNGDDTLEEDLEVASKKLTNLEDEDRISSAETETLSSKASSVLESNTPLPTHEEPNEDKDESIINVDEISNDDIIKINDRSTAKEETAVFETQVQETINVIDDELKSKLDSFKNVVSEVLDKSFSSHDSTAPDDLDLEVKTINENEERRKQDSVNLCDSDSDVVLNTLDYASPVKRPTLKSYASLSDDDVFVTKKSNIFDRSIDSKYCIPLREKQAKVEDAADSVSSFEVFELSDEEKDGENAEDTSSKAVTDDVGERDRSITVDVVERDTLTKEDLITEEQTSIFANSFRRHSLDKTTITMQEIVKTGDDEKSLPDRIHKVVDLFCAGLKNKSDLSVNVSLEFTEVNEDENNKLEISLTATDLKEQEVPNHKGSKRRKICSDLVTQTQEESSTNKSGQEVRSPKKRPKSSICNEVSGTPDFKNSDVVKSSPKVSFSINSENDTSIGKNKSLDTSQENVRKSSPKKTVPLTPYKIVPIEDTGDTTAESTDEEDNDEFSESQDSKTLENLLTKTFDESVNDTTWTLEEQGEEEEEVSDEDVDDEEDLVEETSMIRKEQQTQSPSEPSKRKTRKLFRLSCHNLLDVLGSSESEEASKKITEQETSSQKKKTKARKASAQIVEEKTKSKKKVNSSFETETVGCILPETSETRKKDSADKGRKRRYQSSTSVDEEAPLLEPTKPSSKKKKTQGGKRSKESVVPIKPSVGRKSKKAKALRMKPSRKMSSGWEVTTVT